MRGRARIRDAVSGAAAPGPSEDAFPGQSVEDGDEVQEVVRDIQKRKRQARAKAFDSQLKFSWIQCIATVFSLLLVCSDVPRSGFGINKHLAKYATLEPDLFKLYGPWGYAMLNTSRDDARITQTPVWGYKQDTTSVGLRAFAEFFKLTTFPGCTTYQGPCASSLMSQETVFEMLDSIVNATASLKKPSRSLSLRRQVTEPLFATLRSSNLFLDRLHHFLLHQVFTNPLWRTNQILYYAPELLLRTEPSNATKNVCSDFGQAVPGFCHQPWSNYHYSCPATDPDCRAMGHLSHHTMERLRQVQQMYPGLQVDLTLLESHEDLQLNKGGISPTGMRRDDLVTIVRARKCAAGGGEISGEQGALANDCSTVFISEYRYEIGIVYSDALQWYRIVSWLRGMGQTYYYLRIGMLLKFCFDLVSKDATDDSSRPKQSVLARGVKVIVLLLKMPVQAIIFGSPFPIVCYACAHLIDSAITYEMIYNIFTSQNGFFQLTFSDFCTVAFNQMRSVWTLALVLHITVQVHAWSQRKLSWQPINGIQGVPEFLMSTLSAITILAQMRVKSLRDSRITSIFEIVESQKLQAIKYQHNLGHRDYSHVMLGGVFIDLKFFVLLVALLYVALFAHRLQFLCSRTTASRHKDRTPRLQTKTPVSYAAGVLWPVGAMCVHWASDYFCVKSTERDSHSTVRDFQSVVSMKYGGAMVTPWKPSPPASTTRRPSVLHMLGLSMTTTTFRNIQNLMKSLHGRDDNVEASIAFMNLVSMSDPIVYLCYVNGISGGQQLGYYQSLHDANTVFLLPCAIADAPDWRLRGLKLLWTVRSSELSFADLIHCG